MFFWLGSVLVVVELMLRCWEDKGGEGKGTRREDEKFRSRKPG